MHLKILSVEWQPFCPGGDDLKKVVQNVCQPISPGATDDNNNAED